MRKYNDTGDTCTMILIMLATILIISILLICGDKGSKSIITTTLNACFVLLSIFWIYRGGNPVPITLISCAAISLVVLYYQNEGGVKSHISLVSIAAVFLLVIPLIYIFALNSHGQGFPPEEYEITDSNGYTRNIGVSMLSLQISTMIIALVGVLLDTSVAIVSSIFEISANNKKLTLYELMQASFTVSKAILATSIHTIFYIYIAEFTTLFIQYLNDYSFVAVLNGKSLAKEIISISVSGIGCCLVVPVATVLGSVFITRHHAYQGKQPTRR